MTTNSRGDAVLTDKAKLYMSKVGIEALSLTLLFFASLAIRLYLLFEVPHVVFLHEADGMGYFAIAKSIINNWGLGDTSVHSPPFYPLVIAIVYLFSGDLEIAGRLASCIMGALLVLPVYFIGKELYDRRVGFLSAAVSVFLGTFVEYSLQPITQTTYLTLTMTVIYTGIISIKRPSMPLFLLLGLISAALYLTRPEGIVAFVYIAVVTSIGILANGGLAIEKKIKAISLMFIGFLMLALPYINYIHNQTGMWTVSGKAAVAVIGVDASAKLLSDGRTVAQASIGKVGLKDLFPSPEAFLKTYWENMVKFARIIPNHFPAFSLFLASAGLFVTIISILYTEKSLRMLKALQTGILFAGLAVILPVFAFSTLSIAPSYIFPLFPIITLWFARGLVGIEDGFFNTIIKLTGFGRLERFKEWSLVATASVFLFSFMSISPVWNELSSEDFKVFAASQKFFLKDTGRWLKNNSPKDVAIMSRWSNMGFYADRKWVYIPDGEISEVVKYAKEHNVRYIIIDSNAIPRRRPKLAPLLNPANYEGLRPVYAREEYWIRVIIYEVL